MNDEGSYTCQNCGETIVIPIDATAGSRQKYVEDCPVCCHPHVLRVWIDESGDATVDAEHE